MKSEFRDKRYLGPALRVDLMDAMWETRRWSTLQLIIEAAPLVLQQGGVQEGRKLTGVFTFEGQTIHGMFEASIARRDADDGFVAADFEWISARGWKLLRTMAGQRPGRSWRASEAPRPAMPQRVSALKRGVESRGGGLTWKMRRLSAS